MIDKILAAVTVALAGLIPIWAEQSETTEYAPTVFGAKVTSEPIAPDGTPVQCDLPKELHIRNVGGSDGAGLCVFSSAEMAASYQNVESLFGFQRWMRRHPGGGWPEKLDRMIQQYCRERGYAPPDLLQVQTDNLDLLKLATKTNRLVCSTYCQSPSGRYGGARISHMVNVVHADEKYVCVVDNNFPGSWEFMTPDEYKRSASCGGGKIWLAIFTAPGPPPYPRN